MMKTRNHGIVAMLFLVTTALICACTQFSITEIAESSHIFTLEANCSSENPATKVAFDEDVLNMSWEPGDCLYLIDPTGEKPTVTLTTDITEPAKKATFRSCSSVPCGEYIVLYGQDSLHVVKSIPMTDYYDELNEEIRLFGTLNIREGQASASITLSQLFSMLTFKFKNVPALTKMMLGMIATGKDLPLLYAGNITQDGLISGSSMSSQWNFGWCGGEEGKLFIVPTDFLGTTLYFYIYGDNSNGEHVTYEFVKQGKNLLAGVNYNMTFDFEKANTVSTLAKSDLVEGAYSLTTPAQFRAAAYWGDKVYSVEADVDFTGVPYFPMWGELYGNNHTLSNIIVNTPECLSAGVLGGGWATELTVKNSSFTGWEYVGAVVGICRSGKDIHDCHAENVVVNGNYFVGGLIGKLDATNTEFRPSIINCTVTGESAITGSLSSVGGMLGWAKNYAIYNCLVKGDVSVSGGDTMVGGIVGDYRHSDTGAFIRQCGFEGRVMGGYFVGGIAGRGSVKECYVLGDVTGEGFLGGVTAVGSCYDSYHIGNTTGGPNYDEGGVIGWVENGGYEVMNCYSYGVTSSGYGIRYSLSSDEAASNLTSSPLLSSNESIEENCNLGPDKTFLSMLSVINGNNAYSTQIWEGIDAQCPLLQWQAKPMEEDVTIPGFEDDEW